MKYIFYTLAFILFFSCGECCAFVEHDAVFMGKLIGREISKEQIFLVISDNEGNKYQISFPFSSSLHAQADMTYHIILNNKEYNIALLMKNKEVVSIQAVRYEDVYIQPGLRSFGDGVVIKACLAETDHCRSQTVGNSPLLEMIRSTPYLEGKEYRAAMTIDNEILEMAPLAQEDLRQPSEWGGYESLTEQEMAQLRKSMQRLLEKKKEEDNYDESTFLRDVDDLVLFLKIHLKNVGYDKFFEGNEFFDYIYIEYVILKSIYENVRNIEDEYLESRFGEIHIIFEDVFQYLDNVSYTDEKMKERYGKIQERCEYLLEMIK